MTDRLPTPMAVDGVTTHDPAMRSVSVKVVGVGASFWRRGHRAMVEAVEAGRWDAPTVRASRGGRGDLAKGEPVRDGWLGFKLSDTDYRRLAGAPDLSAIVTVDREAGQILGVKFLGRQSG